MCIYSSTTDTTAILLITYLVQPCRITAIFSTDSLEEQEDLEEFAETDAAKDKNNEEEDQEPETPIAVSIIIEKEGSQGTKST